MNRSWSMELCRRLYLDWKRLSTYLPLKPWWSKFLLRSCSQYRLAKGFVFQLQSFLELSVDLHSSLDVTWLALVRLEVRSWSGFNFQHGKWKILTLGIKERQHSHSLICILVTSAQFFLSRLTSLPSFYLTFLHLFSHLFTSFLFTSFHLLSTTSLIGLYFCH